MCQHDPHIKAHNESNSYMHSMRSISNTSKTYAYIQEVTRVKLVTNITIQSSSCSSTHVCVNGDKWSFIHHTRQILMPKKLFDHIIWQAMNKYICFIISYTVNSVKQWSSVKVRLIFFSQYFLWIQSLLFN